MSEYDWVGGLRGAPYPVIKGRVTGLPMPADAEIVFEGYVNKDAKKMEGPFGEWAGYYASGAREEPFLDIKAVYFRNNPIVCGFPPQVPPDEQQRFRAIQRSALLQQEMAKASVPGVTQTWCHEAGGARMLVAVAIKQLYPGHAESIDITPRAWSTPLDPRISPEDKKAGKMMNSRAVIDATRPWEWRDEFPVVNRPSKGWRKESEDKWGWGTQRG